MSPMKTKIQKGKKEPRNPMRTFERKGVGGGGGRVFKKMVFQLSFEKIN